MDKAFGRLAAAALMGVTAAGADVQTASAQERDFEIEQLVNEYDQTVVRDIGSLSDSIRRYTDPQTYERGLVAQMARRVELVRPNCAFDPRNPNRPLPTGEEFLSGLNPHVIAMTDYSANREMLNEEYGEFERTWRQVNEDGREAVKRIVELQRRRQEEQAR